MLRHSMECFAMPSESTVRRYADGDWVPRDTPNPYRIKARPVRHNLPRLEASPLAFFAILLASTRTIVCPIHVCALCLGAAAFLMVCDGYLDHEQQAAGVWSACTLG